MDVDIFTCIGCGLKSHIVKEQICGHVYCQHCISTAEAKGISVCTLEHLSDETKEEKKLAAETKKEVEKICYFCNSKLDSDNIKSHYDICDLYPVDCPNNCNKKCLRAQMNIHMQECPEHLQTCPFLPLGCNFKGSPIDIAKHEEDKIHLKLLLNVLLKNEQSNICNTTTLKDNTVQQIESYFNMKTVQDDLLKQIEKLKLEIDWCKKRIFELEHQYDLEQNKNSYNQTEVFKKLQDLTVQNIILEQCQAAEYKVTNNGFTDLKQQLSSTNKSIDKESKVLNDKCEKLNEQLEDMELSLDGTNQKLQSIISKNNQLKQSLDNTTLDLRKSIEKLEQVNAQSIKTEEKNDEDRKIITEELGNLKTSCAEDKIILSDEIGGVAESLNLLRVKQDEFAETFEDKLKQINAQSIKTEEKKDKDKKIINEQLGNLKTSFAEDKKILSDEIGGVAESLNALSVKQDEHAKQFGTLKEMIIQQGKKITAFSKSFNFIWKIDNFNTSDYVWSNPFYSDKFGYKMRLNIYCKGDDGEGTHLSVFLCVMKGENDEILDWPVRFTAEVSLLDQSKQKKHYSDILSTEDIESEGCFSKPLTEKNPGWGFPMFISLDKLKCSYLVNNTIFLKANVTFTE